MAFRKLFYFFVCVCCLALLADRSYCLNNDNGGDNSDPKVAQNSNDNTKNTDNSIPIYIASVSGSIITLSGLGIFVYYSRKSRGNGTPCFIINCRGNVDTGNTIDDSYHLHYHVPKEALPAITPRLTVACITEK
uniref:Uncharacterized protein LOC111135268 isoform X2 n=1 Tax=Crassostrea virginica TaxID=6565 RepID=A0A8B8ELX3_CRAVI|nr:uncharacterized protein LOC111135268 isoform X2 [Crassostrea virginica]